MSNWPTGEGEMVRRMRTHDWRSTPLGPIESWSATLRVAVQMMLTQGLPSFLCAGPSRTFLYNDAYAAMVGASHSEAFAGGSREYFSKVDWPFEGVLDRVYAGEALIFRNFAVPFGRDGELEDAWFDFSWCPVCDESGDVIAVSAVIIDVSDRIRAEKTLRAGEERQAFLLQLTDSLRLSGDPDEIQFRACRALAERLGASRVSYADLDDDEVVGIHIRLNRLLAIVRRFPHALMGASMLEAYRRDKTVVVHDINTTTVLTGAEKVTNKAEGIEAFVGTLLTKNGRWSAVLAVHHSRPRVWKPDEVGLILEVAERLWVAVERARTEIALREREDEQAFLIRLSDVLRDALSPRAAMFAAAKTLGEHLAASAVGYSDAEVSGTHIVVERDWVGVEGTSKVGRHLLDSFGFADEMRAGRIVRVNNVVECTSLQDPALVESYTAMGVHAFVNVPVLRSGRFVGMLFVLSATPRAWTDDEVDLIETVADRTRAALERARAEAALFESETRFRQFGEASTDVLWIRSVDTLQCQYLSKAFESVYGLSRDSVLQGADMNRWVDLIVPEDREQALQHLARATEGDHVSCEFRIRRPIDGEIRWMRNTDFPLLNDGGRVVSIGGIGQDITDEKAVSGRLHVLVAELQHRTRNLVAVVQSLADRTLSESTSLESFKILYSDRLAAVGRVQGLLSRLAEGERVTFDQLLHAELSAVTGLPKDSEKIQLSGPNGIRLRSSAVQTLALALHELITNAIKYGALATLKGHLSIHWRVESRGEGEGSKLQVEWRESGVRLVQNAATPQTIGYGRELIERALPYQLNAETRYEIAPDGVLCDIAVPLVS